MCEFAVIGALGGGTGLLLMLGGVPPFIVIADAAWVNPCEGGGMGGGGMGGG
jgi:hypothetical protein